MRDISNHGGSVPFNSCKPLMAQVELFGSAFDDRDLRDPTHDHCLTDWRSVRRFRYGNIQTRSPVCPGLDQ